MKITEYPSYLRLDVSDNGIGIPEEEQAKIFGRFYRGKQSAGVDGVGIGLYIGLMFDMVFNHTSTSHEWFRRALAGEKKYQDYYIFKEGAPDQPPTNWQSKFGGSAWEYVSSLGKWYLHLFDVTQADLNWKNPEVREELKEVIRFWKAKGVKGFRFDVVNLISKPEIWEDDFEGDSLYLSGRRNRNDESALYIY